MISKRIAILINTHSSYEDLWPVIESRVNKFLKDFNIYVLTNLKSDKFDQFNQIIYDEKDDFTTQFLHGLKNINEKYLITLNDDCVVTSEPIKTELLRLLRILETNNSYDFIRLFKGDLINYTNRKVEKKVYWIDNNIKHLYSQSVTLWRLSSLYNLYRLAPKGFIGKKNYLNKYQQKFDLCTEDEVDKIAINNKINGLYYYNNEKKVGHSFYDCSIFPHLNSVIVGGKWNYMEYKTQIINLIKEFKISSNRVPLRFDIKTKFHSFLKKYLNNF